LPTKNAQQNAALRQYTPQERSPLWLQKTSSGHAHARLLPRLFWSWTLLLPTDTHRRSLMSITDVLLPFLTYLLILFRVKGKGKIVPELDWTRHHEDVWGSGCIATSVTWRWVVSFMPWPLYPREGFPDIHCGWDSETV
jgi:hypothetical protein